MCGIIGYVGNQPAVEILKDALTRLEYRGMTLLVLLQLPPGPCISAKTKVRLPMLSRIVTLKICLGTSALVMSAGQPMAE
jgi:glucosamine--fructose-6-phosphate aminotransferase (isomerizing)